MHIAMISRGYPSKEYPTMGNFEADTAHALARAGVQVSFLAVDMRSFRRKRPWGLRVEKTSGITVYHIDWPVGAVPKKLFYRLAFQALKRAWRRMEREEGTPELIHTLFTDYGVLGAMMKERTGIPLYLCENFSRIHVDPIDPALKEAAAFAYEKADVIQTVSVSMQKRLREVFGADSVVIPNLPDLSLFRYEDNEKEDLLVTAGRITKEKGMPELVDAFLLLKDEFPQLRLELFGEGDQRAPLEEKAKKAGVSERILFRGAVPREVMAKSYRKARWFALASHHETFGLAYIEAWAAGLPALVTRCGGPDTFVTPENGVLVPPKNLEALTRGLRNLLTTDYDRPAIARRAADVFSEERIIGETLQLYKTMKRM